MQMNASSIVNQKAEWEKLGVKLPAFDHAAMTVATKEHPIWVHFGAGNIFRGFIAALQQRLLNEGLADRGIIAADTFDYDIIDKIYTPYDNLTMNVTLNPDGTTSREIIGSVAEGLRANSADAEMMARFKQIFTDPGLQMISFTITEKGYALYRPDGSLMPVVQADIDEGPAHARHAMSMVAALLLERFQNGAAPLAVVSMDNCSHNGEKLQASVMTVAKAWLEKGYVGQDFIDYLSDESKITFPWSMIDKITPRPHKMVEESLEKDGIEGMAPIVTSKNTFIAAFVNAERPQYLVVEDKFPNGRPALEKAGVYLTDRETVNKTERMKVTTCLNPLHTAMSVYGCMLGYDLICAEMKDEDIVALIKRLGYVEGLPVVVDPKILDPKAFIDEVIEQRLLNPFMPDMPQRIATDTSQKVGIRFGETIKSYIAEGRDLNSLVSIPLAIAGWLRYLLAIDDNGNAFEVSADPLKDDLQAKLAGIEFGKPETVTDQLNGILSNASIFGTDLTKTVLADKIKAYFKAEIAGAGAVRKTLHEAVNG
ncbi:MAG: mannitol dehydrogenase family protein [Gemmiger sp.]|uniref:mannitol dehydrogenase family protein n=1 Tax=Gemmiger sp. TaxID=2049027 RepID=UPI002E7A05D7|nr:mannitol dehydrogenase family protein [Gemmiger sp.]MEE0497270.1 mannitol dehydrogenase family protein [Gemmiger sp.]